MNYVVVLVTSFYQNCSIIWCEKTNEALLVDPGGDSCTLINKINTLGVNVKKILLTHGHIDHVGASMELKKYYKVPILGPNKNDEFLLENLSLQLSLLNCKDYYIDNVVVPNVWLKDGDSITIGNEIFDVIHCPGHSPGHITFYNKKRKFIVMGDVLFKNGIGRTDLPGGKIDILLDSIKNKLLILGDDICFLPGHGDLSTLGYERLNNKFLK